MILCLQNLLKNEADLFTIPTHINNDIFFKVSIMMFKIQNSYMFGDVSPPFLPDGQNCTGLEGGLRWWLNNFFNAHEFKVMVNLIINGINGIAKIFFFQYCTLMRKMLIGYFFHLLRQRGSLRFHMLDLPKLIVELCSDINGFTLRFIFELANGTALETQCHAVDAF